MKFSWLETACWILFCVVVLAGTIRGIAGNPTDFDINLDKWKDNGPFELSPDRGRFAITLSLLENHSFYFSLPIARFATPDLGYANGRYVSLFAPGLSFVVMPGYIVGRMFGLSQVGTYAIISLFAIFNTLLIRAIAKHLGATPIAATIAAFAFLFGTPAFTYAVNLYQHHVTTFILLSSLLLVLKYNSAWSLALVWFLAACSIPLDYPNLFLMIPVGLAALGKFFIIEDTAASLKIKFKALWVFTFVTAIFPVLFLGWFNNNSYGSPLQFTGSIHRVKAIDAQGKPTAPQEEKDAANIAQLLNPEREQNRSVLTFFQPRNLVNGLYIHFFSPDRSILWFTPIMFAAILGFIVLYQTNPTATALLVSTIGSNVLLYAMWGDPWGGWAFGSRYLIPTYAVAAIALAILFTKAIKKPIVLAVLFALLSYSVIVNTIGALTTNRNPPQEEVLALEQLSHREEKYTYARDYDMLLSNQSKSFVYQTYLRQSFTAWQYFAIIALLLVVTAWSYLVVLTL